jgi:hypothetical protein
MRVQQICGFSYLKTKKYNSSATFICGAEEGLIGNENSGSGRLKLMLSGRWLVQLAV